MTAHPASMDAAPEAARLVRVEVWPSEGRADPEAAPVAREAAKRFDGFEHAQAARVYLLQGPFADEQIERIAHELLADPVNQRAHIGARSPDGQAATLEVHHKPGVMDPVAQSTREAIAEAEGDLRIEQVQVSSGHRYDLHFAGEPPLPDEAALRDFAEHHLANSVIHEIHLEPFQPAHFPQGHAYRFQLQHVDIRGLDDEGLERLSREGHLFLSLEEMQAIQAYYRQVEREPTDIELETLAQTWSEHCVHKTLKSTVHYHQSEDNGLSFHDRPGHEVHEDGSVTIDNLLKSTVAAATHRLMSESPYREWCVSVFEDNAGIVRFDDEDGVCIKVETHNHPSAIEPYGGAATGIGGCIRDILGTGLAARPVANTDVFCVADPALAEHEVPRGIIHPRRILQQVVAGVRDYGNRMGIPTVNGAVCFHNDYIGNPLVFAGCVGLIPLDKCFGHAKPGDRIIALGGRTGRDGIHGATFSSAELTDAHADEFSHAVQIGNPITQKKMLDVILQARDHEQGCLYSAITDCGAGGFSSAVGEMGEQVGAYVELDKAPLKYEGLSYTEIWISEAQERMVLAVPPDQVETLRELCRSEEVGFCDLGQFGCDESGAAGDPPAEPMLLLNYAGHEVGRLSMHLLHEGIPTPVRRAEWHGREVRSGGSFDAPSPMTSRRGADEASIADLLTALLGHPDIASKHWIIRQYDHEVQGGSAVKPLVGEHQDGPSDAAVIRPKLDSPRGVALACGLAPLLSEKATQSGLAIDGDSYWATLAALDEAVRNAVCVGASPERLAILDNFCWPRCDDPQQLGSLVRAAEACYDGALAYTAPFVSGKDSLSNQFTAEDGRLITIPPTLLITAMGMVEDVSQCVTMDPKDGGSLLIVVGVTGSALGGSHYRCVVADDSRDGRIPRVDLQAGPVNARAVAGAIQAGWVRAAHDCSDGGLLTAAAEMAMAGRRGLALDLAPLPATRQLDTISQCFAESPSRYLLEIAPESFDALARHLQQHEAAFAQIGRFNDSDRLTLRSPREGQLLDVPLQTLHQAWTQPLDW